MCVCFSFPTPNSSILVSPQYLPTFAYAFSALQLGDRALDDAIQNVTKAELSRVFAAIHLEQISSAAVEGEGKGSQQVTLALALQGWKYIL